MVITQNRQKTSYWVLPCSRRVKAALLSVFREDFTNFLIKPKHLRHDLMVKVQYPQALTSTAKKCMDQPLALVAE